MSVIFMDGFDAQDAKLKYTNTLSSDPTYAIAARYGTGSCMTLPTATSGALMKYFTAASKVFMGAAVYVSSLSASRTLWGMNGDSGATAHTSVRVSTNGTVQVYRGSTLLASSASGVISQGVWCYVESAFTISDTVGVIEVKVNGISVISTTGDTKNAGTNTTIDAVVLGSTSPDGVVSLDDLYILNDSGSAPLNTYLGEVVVQTLVPTGAGNSTGLTPVGSANNWDNVNELPYSTSDYNSGTTSGQEDLYTMSDVLSSTGTIFAVQNNFIGGKTGPGVAKLKSALRSGSTDYFGSDNTLSASPLWFGTIRETDPATSAAWTSSGVNALQAGVEVV